MCGIIGFNWRDEELVRRLNDLMAHRGPKREVRRKTTAFLGLRDLVYSSVKG